MTGQPLAFSLLRCASLQAFLDFYAGELGFDASPVADLGGAAFERHWSLPPGATGKGVLLSVGGSPVGRIVGIELDGVGDAPLATGKGPFLGYWNMNFYCDDIDAAVAELERKGRLFWTRPVRNQVAGGQGAPVEAIFLGADNVAINLLELSGPPGSPVGILQQETANMPRSRAGYSQVATSAHAAKALPVAAAFYRDVLGMHVAIDAVLENPEVNALTGRPRDARTHVLWMKGDHPYGKVALSQPLNYALEDRSGRALANATGYVAQGFQVPDLDAAIGAAERAGAVLVAPPDDIPTPGVGMLRAAMLRTPGSGALVQLSQL